MRGHHLLPSRCDHLESEAKNRIVFYLSDSRMMTEPVSIPEAVAHLDFVGNAQPVTLGDVEEERVMRGSQAAPAVRKVGDDVSLPTNTADAADRQPPRGDVRDADDADATGHDACWSTIGDQEGTAGVTDMAMVVARSGDPSSLSSDLPLDHAGAGAIPVALGAGHVDPAPSSHPETTSTTRECGGSGASNDAQGGSDPALPRVGRDGVDPTAPPAVASSTDGATGNAAAAPMSVDESSAHPADSSALSAAAAATHPHKVQRPPSLHITTLNVDRPSRRRSADDRTEATSAAVTMPKDSATTANADHHRNPPPPPLPSTASAALSLSASWGSSSAAPTNGHPGHLIPAPPPATASAAATTSSMSPAERLAEHYGTGVAQHRAGNYADAVRSFNRAAFLAPQEPLPYVAQSESYLALLDFRSAIVCLKKAMKLMAGRDPSASRDVKLRLAQVMDAASVFSYRAGRFHAAVQLADSSLSESHTPHAVLHRALALLGLGKFDEADAALVALITETSTSVELLSSSMAVAAKATNNALRGDNEREASHGGRGGRSPQQGAPSGAEVTDTAALAAISVIDADARVLRAQVCIQRRDFSAARMLLEKARARHPNHPRLEDAERLFDTIFQLFRAEAQDSVDTDCLSQCINCFPEDAELYRARAVAYIGRKQYTLAVQDLFACLQKSGGSNPVATTIMGSCLATIALELEQLGDYAGAVNYYTESLKWSERSSDVLFARGRCHQCMGKHEHALADYKSVLLLDPTNPRVRRQLAQLHDEWGSILYNEKHYQLAETELSRAIAYDTEGIVGSTTTSDSTGNHRGDGGGGGGALYPADSYVHRVQSQQRQLVGFHHPFYFYHRALARMMIKEKDIAVLVVRDLLSCREALSKVVWLSEATDRDGAMLLERHFPSAGAMSAQRSTANNHHQHETLLNGQDEGRVNVTGDAEERSMRPQIWAEARNGAAELRAQLEASPQFGPMVRLVQQYCGTLPPSGDILVQLGPPSSLDADDALGNRNVVATAAALTSRKPHHEEPSHLPVMDPVQTHIMQLRTPVDAAVMRPCDPQVIRAAVKRYRQICAAAAAASSSSTKPSHQGGAAGDTTPAAEGKTAFSPSGGGGTNGGAAGPPIWASTKFEFKSRLDRVQVSKAPALVPTTTAAAVVVGHSDSALPPRGAGPTSFSGHGAQHNSRSGGHCAIQATAASSSSLPPLQPAEQPRRPTGGSSAGIGSFPSGREPLPPAAFVLQAVKAKVLVASAPPPKPQVSKPGGRRRAPSPPQV